MRTRTHSLVAVLLAFVFMLTGCTAKITEGSVVDKSYRDAYTSTYMHCMTRNSDGICTMNVPRDRDHPESWRIVISGVNEKGEEDTARYRVSESTYESIEIGDYFRTE